MSKLNQKASANVTVLDETKLEQVVGGHHGGSRRHNYGHCYNHRHNKDRYNYGGGHEDKTYGEEGFDSASGYGEGESY